MSRKVVSSRSRTLIFILFIVLVLLVARVVYDTVDKASLVEDSEAKSLELQSAYEAIDSVQREVESKIVTIQELGGKVDTLLRIREDLKQERSNLLKRNRSEITILRSKVEGYTALLLKKDAEIERLQETNQLLTNENTTLKTTQNKLERSISSLKNTQK